MSFKKQFLIAGALMCPLVQVYASFQEPYVIPVITAEELFETIQSIFKPGVEDFYEDYLDNRLKDAGYRVYLEDDQKNMVILLNDLRIFVDQVPRQDVPNSLYVDINQLEEELKNELRLSEPYVNSNLTRDTGARAARSAYYVNRFSTLNADTAIQQ